MGSFTINPRELRAALRFVGFGTEKFNTVPILANVLVEPGENGAVTFRSTNLDLEMFATVSCEHQGFDAFTIRPGFFHDMIRFADGPATFEVDGDMLRARCDDMRASARILCPAAGWPALVIDSTSEANAEISEAVLHKALSAVRPCVSTEETRYYLNGAYLHPIDGYLCAVATDGHRLARYQSDVEWKIPAGIYHTDLINALMHKLRPGGNGTIKVRGFFIKSHRKTEGDPEMLRVEIAGEDWKIRAKLIDGTYPNYNRVIPNDKAEVKIEVTISHNALRRFPTGIDGGSTGLKIDPESGKMLIRSPYYDGCMEMPVQGFGPAFGLNIKYLKAFAAPAGVIRLRGTGTGDPFLVHTEDPSLTQVVMPMRV